MLEPIGSGARRCAGATTALVGRVSLRRVNGRRVAVVFCAMRNFGRGLVVYRPARIFNTGAGGAGRRFEAQLYAYCTEEAARRAAARQ